MDILSIFNILGLVLRALGAFVFGIGVGWLTLRSFDDHRGSWQFALGAFLGLLGVFALLGHWVSGSATIGGFSLGAGLALLIWGMRSRTGSAPSMASNEPAKTVMK